MPGSMFAGGRYVLGDATYGARRKGAMYGDPGFGALIGLGSAIVPGIKKVAGKVVGKLGAGARTPPIAPPAGTLQKIRRVAGPVAAIGAGTAAGELALRIAGPSGERRSYRRMNPLNPKALKRATRRLAGFHTFAENTEKELRKLAPAKRACAPRKPSCR